MKVVFLTNYYNHHQAPFSEAMNRLTNGNYIFIETSEMSQQRCLLGYGIEKPSFVVMFSNENKNELQNIIDVADVVITGSAPENLIKNRLKSGKIVLRYSERWYKKGFQWWKWPAKILRHQFRYGCFRNVYMLCASAFTAADCAKTGLYLNKTYKWGYFPAVKKYEDIDKLVEEKEPASILWVARLIGWKHPDASIRIAARLKEDGYRFKLRIIGNGEMQDQLQRMIDENDLNDCVQMLGSMRPDQVREYMEKSRIFLFTSDRNEGWGAVLNESMNSACTVIASHAIGSVPFLITDTENAFVYHSGDEEELLQKVKHALDNPMMCKSIGKKAYGTIFDVWNADEAARRLLLLVDDLQKNGKSVRFESGPCSKAEIIKDGWYI